MLNVRDNNINYNAAGEIATVLLHHRKLQVIDLGNNNLLRDELTKITKGLLNTSNIIEIDLGDNK